MKNAIFNHNLMAPRLGEFGLINKFFKDCGRKRHDCVLGIGDDAALLQPAPDMELVVTQDTLVANVHFFAATDPNHLGYKALAVNLSDLAAMGAEPAWFTLGLTLPDVDSAWLASFAAGLCELAYATGIRLVGGDTTRGPLACSITALGFCPLGTALRRTGAKPGDAIYVSGTVGDAGLALQGLRQGKSVSAAVLERLERPIPRLALGQALRGLAHAAIDISDGLAADLLHILHSSEVGADLQLAKLPCSMNLQEYLEQGGDPILPLIAGDDYELCFTIEPQFCAELEAKARQLNCSVTCIGKISSREGLRVYGANGQNIILNKYGYEHFN